MIYKLDFPMFIKYLDDCYRVETNEDVYRREDGQDVRLVSPKETLSLAVMHGTKITETEYLKHF